MKKNLKTDFRVNKNILWFDEIGISDIHLVGGKNSSLGEMYKNLTNKGIEVPFGFAITSFAYNYFITEKDLKKFISKTLSDLNTKNLLKLQEKGKAIRDKIIENKFPEDLKQEIIISYKKLEKIYGKNCDVAIRSSATAEDLPDASFAGQQETYLNIRNEKQLLHSCKKCYASLFTDRAISYRVDKNFSHFDIALSIGVQKMVRADLSSSGVMFSIDTESGFRDVVFITSSYGLGENIVQGAVNPDEFLVHKPTLAKDYRSIIYKKVGDKDTRMVYSESKKNPTKNVPVPIKDRNLFSITNNEIITLAKWAVIIEKHYSKKRGVYTPMDMEWAKDGKTGKLYIVQARPETVQSQRNFSEVEEYRLLETSKILCRGSSIGNKIGTGKARVIRNIKEANTFKKGDVLVTDMTDPDWQPIMKIASAIVTNRGGRTCHAAIISREMGVPCVIGTRNATTEIGSNKAVTVDCSSGEVGYVYNKELKYESTKIDIKNLKKTKTKLMLNVGNSHLAFTHSFLPNDGVGLARLEFIINEEVRIHPYALINFQYFKKKSNKKELAEVEKLTLGYKNKIDYYVGKLAEGIGIIGAAFYPKKVIIRFSDFKSNEYWNLLGGRFFEPIEENPMLGFRGASRYYSKQFYEAFKLECLAIKKVNEVFGLTNTNVMIPFCRTVKELKNVLKILNDCGIKSGKRGMKIYLMCEIPSNVILADEFLQHVDGYSIGSNDLTQLALGVDRDSELVSHVYDERNKAVLKLLSDVVKKCNSLNKYVGICGQAPSDYPEIARFLVEHGIQTMSLNPDSIVKTQINVAKLEKKLNLKP